MLNVKEIFNSDHTQITTDFKIESSVTVPQPTGKELVYYIDYTKGSETNVIIEFLNSYNESDFFKINEIDSLTLDETNKVSIRVKAQPVNSLRVKSTDAINSNTNLKIKTYLD